MSITYINKWMDSFLQYTNDTPRLLVLFHLTLRVIYCCSSYMTIWKIFLKKYNISSGAFFFWFLIKLDLFCGSANFSVRGNILVSGRVGPNIEMVFYRRWGTIIKLKSNKVWSQKPTFLMLPSNKRKILLVTNIKTNIWNRNFDLKPGF